MLASAGLLVGCGASIPPIELIDARQAYAQGSSRYNRESLQLRADAVPGYIISCGYPSVLVHARGVGRNRTVAENATAEGRTKNLRVEIIVGRADRQQGSIAR